MPVTFPLYVMALASFIGWFFFILFAGVGFSALPLDYILEFKYRPRALGSRQMTEVNNKLSKKANELISRGNKLQDEEKELRKRRGCKCSFIIYQ